MKSNSTSPVRSSRDDLVLIAISLLAAVWLLKSGLVSDLLTVTKGRELLGSFIAGIFFTSVFTTAPATVTLGQIAQANSIWLTALFGALGAVLGDLAILRFFRGVFEARLAALLAHRGPIRRLRAIFRLKLFRWFLLLIGGLIIASPLPDELGISLLGFSKAKRRTFVIVSFAFNFIGILIIGLVAKSLQ